jgi:hypothetical protein
VGAIGCAKVASPEALCPVAHGIPLPTHIAVPLVSGERVVGNFAFNVVEQFSDTPGAVSVLVSFEMTCQASAQC